MSVLEEAVQRLESATAPAGPLGRALADSGTGFAAVGGPLQLRWEQAWRELADCLRPLDHSEQLILHEGGGYQGCWLESTATICAETLDRFAPDIVRATQLGFARHQRADGLLPYKLTPAGPGFCQIQMVTPLARSVWRHYQATGDRDHLRALYRAMARMDDWLAAHRDTRGTGGVEIFCAFDTGHDNSPRCWFMPQRCHLGDAARWDPDYPGLPLIAPDLTANVACQRDYLALMAAELGGDPTGWRAKAAASRAALWRQCHDAEDQFFYDRDAAGRPRRVQSDVLLRVLACEVGDDACFDAALESYLLHSAKFASPYGFTSLALDDPRFDHDYRRNSWGGPINLLSLLRAPDAFEPHGRLAELATVQLGALAALAVADRFPQCLDPWSGEPGFASAYAPCLLWFIDTIERCAGLLARPDGELWLNGLDLTRLEAGAAPRAWAHARRHAGQAYVLAGDGATVQVGRDGSDWLSFPAGWRVVVADGRPTAVIGLARRPPSGELVWGDRRWALSPGPNERLDLTGPGGVRPVSPPRLIDPSW
ncbi:MAG: hypothetical protein LBK42_08500 [Propionibacteriaceae bacterium]|jgi:hypothetical protein|nr:hypothetical protein [Propionibacteriaceae bacterium]